MRRRSVDWPTAMSKPRLSVLVLVVVLACALFAGGVWAKLIVGTAGNDTLRGRSAADVLQGKGGNDKLYGLAGNDRLVGGAGNDLLVGGAGADAISCGPGRDVARGDRSDRVGSDCEKVSGVTKPPSSPPAPPTPEPLPGVKVDVGGYKLYLECSGSGSPTVVLEQGRPAMPRDVLRSFSAVIAAETRVCWYDRAGVEGSDRRPVGLQPTGARFSQELRTLLANASIPGPYVLVGPSDGGLLSVSHAIRYPNDFVGFVFVDAFTPWNLTPGGGDLEGSESIHVNAELGELQAVQFGSRPVIAVIADLPAGSELARRSSNRVLVSTSVGHLIFRDAPQLAIAATRLAVAAVRNGTTLPPCEQTTLPGVGGTCEAVG